MSDGPLGKALPQLKPIKQTVEISLDDAWHIHHFILLMFLDLERAKREWPRWHWSILDSLMRGILDAYERPPSDRGGEINYRPEWNRDFAPENWPKPMRYDA